MSDARRFGLLPKILVVIGCCLSLAFLAFSAATGQTQEEPKNQTRPSGPRLVLPRMQRMWVPRPARVATRTYSKNSNKIPITAKRLKRKATRRARPVTVPARRTRRKEIRTSLRVSSG